MKRIQVQVRWGFRRWVVKTSNVGSTYDTKREAVARAAAYCRKRAAKGEFLELTIFNKNGRISKGNGARRTYPRSSDPRRHKG